MLLLYACLGFPMVFVGFSCGFWCPFFGFSLFVVVGVFLLAVSANLFGFGVFLLIPGFVNGFSIFFIFFHSRGF